MRNLLKTSLQLSNFICTNLMWEGTKDHKEVSTAALLVCNTHHATVVSLVNPYGPLPHFGDYPMASKSGRVKNGPDGPGSSCPTSLDVQERGAATEFSSLPLAKGMIFPMSGDEHSSKTLGLGFF